MVGSMHPKWIMRLFTVICALIMGVIFPLTAHADNCSDLDSNPTWNNNFQQLNLAYKSENWNQALKISRDLEDICEFSPILNYTIARIHKNRNDQEKYLFYLQKATQNTERFSVDKNLLDQMWAEKYIVAHPEASPESIEAYQREIESLKNANADKSEEMKVYKSVMWTGAGIGIGGLVLTATGLALALKTEAIEFHAGVGNKPSEYIEQVPHALGWTLIGIGGTMTVIGSVLAGVYGYKYKHFFDNANLSFQISPHYSSIQIYF